jgi:hypothetical protein
MWAPRAREIEDRVFETQPFDGRGDLIGRFEFA